ncbi:tRNA modification GTPase MnmE [Planctomycetales bacterium 10988]|nr:tRNA modification GTPase MnmE [Planctomycetales bacterium 10988]
MKWARLWLVVLTFLFIPYLLLIPAAFLWLYEKDLLIYWLILLTVLSLLSWPVLLWARRQMKKPIHAEVKPSEYWDRLGNKAWEEVDAIAQEHRRDDITLEKGKEIGDLVKEVLESVARVYHPDSSDPLLEVPVPHLLQIVENVSRDLRQATMENLPGSHLITINDFQRFGRLANLASKGYLLYRVVAFGVNPVSGLMRELRQMGTRQLMNASKDEMKYWATEFCIKRIGYYAIELYSGKLTLDEQSFQTYVSPTSQAQIEDSKQVENEPLRILLLGQVKSGKSSLVNALFGEKHAAVDVIPLTQGVDPYYQAKGDETKLPSTIVLDTAGYEDEEKPEKVIQGAIEEMLKSDLLLLVLSATSAAREADVKLLTAIRLHFEEKTTRDLPPIIVVLTHVDQLRPFREWNPPYDLNNPQTKKAKHIREAVELISQELLIDPSLIIPVCLYPERLYNVKEALSPAISSQLDFARRAQYLRCLQEKKEGERWSQLWKQTQNAGRVLTTLGLHAAKHTLEKVDDYTRDRK